jgi:hypothetical protein
MGLFDGGDRVRREQSEVRAELARLEGLSLDDLAAVVLTTLFGSDGAADDGVVDMWRITIPFDRHRTGLFPGMPKEVRTRYLEVVEEGVQRLEHQGLVVVRVSGRDQTSVELRLTRAGRRALEGPLQTP